VDLVLVALFAVVGDGLAPFRAVDTYHMCFIARYAHLTWKVRKQHQLPELPNPNDLPHDTLANNTDIELGMSKEDIQDPRFSVLTPKQQQRLEHHQKKFSKSHTYYKPHETQTHRAFSIKLLIAITVLLDMHSCLQIALGSVTWSTDYKTRSQVPTTVILCCSITCNIVAGLLISRGDKRSRKTEVVERIARQALTQEAMKHLRKKKRKEEKERLRALGLDPHDRTVKVELAPRLEAEGEKNRHGEIEAMDRTIEQGKRAVKRAEKLKHETGAREPTEFVTDVAEAPDGMASLAVSDSAERRGVAAEEEREHGRETRRSPREDGFERAVQKVGDLESRDQFPAYEEEDDNQDGEDEEAAEEPASSGKVSVGKRSADRLRGKGRGQPGGFVHTSRNTTWG